MIVIGHRGAAGLKPENTLLGFEEAIRLGVDMIECDIRRTAGGHLVIMHDATVDRTTNGRGAVVELQLSEVRSLDAGAGERVPLLDEVLELIQKRGVPALLEIKALEAVEPTVAAVRSHRLFSNVIVTGNLAATSHAKELAPECQVGVPFHTPTESDVRAAANLGAQGVGIHFTALTEDHMRLCKELGLFVRAWNPITEEQIRSTIAYHPDGITTDRPDLVLALRGL